MRSWVTVAVVVATAMVTMAGDGDAAGFESLSRQIHSKEGMVQSEKAKLRIIGGTAVSEEERLANFPWIAMLGGSLPRCGGAIVSEWWILTAAHCVLNAAETQIIPAADSQRVYFGCSDLHSTTYPCQQRTVKEIVANPCFDPCCDYHDIAMLKVDKAMPKTFVGEIDGSRTNIPVPMFPFDISKEKVVMMGWGSTCGDGRCVPSVLQKLEVPVSTMQKCKDVNPVNNGISSGHCGQSGRCKNLFEYGHVICAGGSMADQGGYDSCNGDSGSPVAWKSSSGWRIVGLVILGSEYPQSDWKCGAVGRHSVLTATAAVAFLRDSLAS